MTDTDRALETTTSLCPSCLERVPGEYVTDGEPVSLRRECPEHGETTRRVWDSLDHWEWAREFQPDAEFDPEGAFTVDNDHACLAVVEVTSDCNLSCSYCFASSGPGGTHNSAAEVESLLQTVLDSGGPRPIQFSGGEPTVRDDFPELVERAQEMGFDHVQVNTNGIELAERDGYAERLAEGFPAIEPRDLMPVPCCSAYCQSATALLPTDDGPVALTQFLDDALFEGLSGTVDEADWMELVANTPAGKDAACCSTGCCGDVVLPTGADELLDRVLPVSLTGFTDADAADAGRLDNCCISVPTPDGELVPFCGYNMTTEDGRYALRNRNDWGGRPAVNEPVPTEGDAATGDDSVQVDDD